MTSQVLRHVSVECTRCSSKYDNALAWRLVSAVERPEDVRRLGDLLMVQCVTCQTPIQHGHPVVVLDWLPYVPILCVLPNGWDFAPAGTEDLEQLLHMAGKSLQDVVWVPQVRADGLSPVAVDRWVSSGAFETPEHEFFRQFLDRWLDARAREVPPAILRWAGETDDQALANFPWMATGFLTRVQDQVRKQVGPSRPDLAPAMTAFVERLGSGGGAPPLEFRTRIQDVVSKTNIPARLKLLLKKASDENLEPAARISVAERGLGLSESTDEDPFVAFFSEALYRVRRMYLPMTSDNLRENVALLRNALAAASRAEITDYALHLQFQLADAIREAATDREQHQECLDLYEDAVSRLPPTIEAARLSLIDSNYALMLMNAYDAGLGSALLFEASRRIDAALAYRMGRGPSIDLVYSLHSRGLITSRLVRHADQTDTPPEVLVARAFSDVDAAVEICRQIGADRPDLLPTILAERLDVNEHFSTDGPMKEAARRRQVDHAAEITTDETLPTNLRGRAWSVLGLLDDDTHGPMATLLERAIEFLDADSDPFLRVRTFTGLGKEAAKSGAWKNAAQNFERAFNLWSTTLDARVAAGLFESSKARQNDPAGRWAGYCYAKAGDLERAVELVEASLCFETGWLQRRRASELRHIEQVMPELARAYRNTLAAAEALQGAQGYGDARKKLESIAEQIRTHGVSNFLSLTRFEEIVQRASETNPIVYVVLTPWGIAHLIVTGRHGDPARLIELKGLTAMDIEELTQGHIGSSGGFTAGMVTSSTTDEWIESTGRTLAVIGPSLIAPLLSALDTSIASAITFVVTGHLQGVPLHAAPLNLRADARCLWDYLDVDYVPASVFRRTADASEPRDAPRADMFLALADPHTSSPPLPGARLEAVAAFGVQDREAHVVFGDRATRGFIEVMSKGRIVDVHLACHGRRALEAGSPLLEFADGAIHFDDAVALFGDGRVREIFAAACHSGAPSAVVPLDEVYAFPTACLIGGARDVVATAWPVDDGATSLVVLNYYLGRELLGLTPAQAIRSACLWVRDASAKELRIAEERLKDRASRRDGEVLNLRDVNQTRSFWTRVFGDRAPTAPLSDPYYWGGFMTYSAQP